MADVVHRRRPHDGERLARRERGREAVGAEQRRRGGLDDVGGVRGGVVGVGRRVARLGGAEIRARLGLGHREAARAVAAADGGGAAATAAAAAGAEQPEARERLERRRLERAVVGRRGERKDVKGGPRVKARERAPQRGAVHWAAAAAAAAAAARAVRDGAAVEGAAAAAAAGRVNVAAVWIISRVAARPDAQPRAQALDGRQLVGAQRSRGRRRGCALLWWWWRWGGGLGMSEFSVRERQCS